MENNNRFSNHRNPAVSIGLGVVLSILVMLIGTLGVTSLLLNDSITTEGLGISVLVITELAVVFGCTFSTLRTGRAILPVALGTGLGFFVVQLSITALFFDGQYHGALVTLFAVLSSSVAVALVILKYMNQPKRYRKKR